jgi:outer membrane lipoprotein-sorting protein
MKHLVLILALFLLAAPAQAAVGEHIADIQKAEDYLRGLGTVQADFVLKDSNGTRLSGIFSLNRPGRLRFDYNEVEDFIVADGFFIYFYDAQMREQTNAPIGQTLADFLLRKDLRLSGDVTVTGVTKGDGQTAVTLVQTNEPGAGSLQLFFSDVPFQLKRWVVRDALGNTTEIMLKNMKRGVTFPSGTFAYVDPRHGKGGRYN